MSHDPISRITCLATLTLTLYAGSVRGQTTCDEAPSRRGHALRRRGRDAEALDVFRQAWERCHTARARAQMALAEAAVERWADAWQHLAEALSNLDDPWIARNRPALEDVRSQVDARLGRLEVRGNVEGAEVLLDARSVGALPLREPLRVAPGAVTLRVRAPGYAAVTRSVTITAGSLTQEDIELTPTEPPRPEERAQPTEPSRPTAVEPSPARAPSSTPIARPLAVSAPVVDPTRGRVRRAFGWAAAGGAALALGGGTWALFARQSAEEAYLGRCYQTGVAIPVSECEGYRDAYATAEALAVAGFVTGAALAVTSVVLFVTAPSGTRRDSRAGLMCGHGPGDVGITCATRF